VVEIRTNTASRVVKDFDGLAILVGVAVGADEVAADVEVAGESIDAGVVVFRATSGAVVVIAFAVTSRLVIGASGGEGEDAEVIVEGMVLLHDDDDVLDLAYIAFGARGAGKDDC
jgi:hypothetical protein